MDPLEDVLALLDTTSHLSTSMAAGGSWAIRFEPVDGIKFNAIRRGRCFIRVEGVDQPISLGEGDCFLLTRPRAFALYSDPQATPVEAHPIFARAMNGVAHAGDGDDLYAIGGRFTFGHRARDLLLDELPPVIHVPAGTPEAATVQWALGQIDAELRDRPLASSLVAEHLALVMLIHVLRLQFARTDRPTSGWLTGLSDPAVAAALKAMHARPAHPWTVAELAQASAVSRSTLAARFKHLVGQGPLDYLTRWRIELASHRLRRGTDTLAAIAHAVGYGSESALSNAFKRVMGIPPRDYRRQDVTNG